MARLTLIPIHGLSRQNGEQVALLVKNMGEGGDKDERCAGELARLESLLEATKKELRKELKKIRETLQDSER